MITTGIIKSRKFDENNTLIYSVEISIFKEPGSTTDSNILNYTLDTSCCITPGVYEAYNVEDRVYVGFINNEISNPVILGKIYKNIPDVTGDKPAGYHFIDSLNVKSSARLPEDTMIGDFTFKVIKEYIQDINNLKDKVAELSAKLYDEQEE